MRKKAIGNENGSQAKIKKPHHNSGVASLGVRSLNLVSLQAFFSRLWLQCHQATCLASISSARNGRFPKQRSLSSGHDVVTLRHGQLSAVWGEFDGPHRIHSRSLSQPISEAATPKRPDSSMQFSHEALSAGFVLNLSCFSPCSSKS